MDITQILTLLTDKGVSLVIVALIIYACYKGVPIIGTWIGKKIDYFFTLGEKFVEKQVQTMDVQTASMKEIVKTNSELATTVNTLAIRMDNVERKIDDIDEKVDTLIKQ